MKKKTPGAAYPCCVAINANGWWFLSYRLIMYL